MYGQRACDFPRARCLVESLRVMCYTCVVFNKMWVKVLDTIRFQPTYFGSVGSFEGKKMNVCAGGT